MVRIFCKNNSSYKEFPEGTTLLEMIPSFGLDDPLPFICAKVNNVLQGLKYKAYNSRDVEFLTYSSYGGRSVFCRSLCFLLCKAAGDVLPGCKVALRRPISKGYFCKLRRDAPPTEEELQAIRSRMEALVRADLPFKRVEARTEDAIGLFRALGHDDKVKLLETCDQLYISYHILDGMPDYWYDALLPSTGYLINWDLSLFKDGLLLRVPDRHNPSSPTVYVEQPKTYEVFNENLSWNSIMGLETVGDVNKAILRGESSDLIRISEALQEKKIVRIAEEIDRRYRAGSLKLVLITGPSSSGKTTVTSRLCTQLKACGLKPSAISTDDYFVDRVKTPKLPDGSYDFDNCDTVEHDLMQKDIIRMLDGEEVRVPEFNFVTGLREYNGKTVHLKEGCILIVEGIHALNPALTSMIDEQAKFKIFINTIVSIPLDNHNCIPTSDNRLLRRIVRDFNKGAFTARQSIAAWPMVRRNEVKWIYPFQETADVLFNSAYLVEFAVLRSRAEQVLGTVPRNCPEYGEAHRLLKFLSYFRQVDDREIPPTSLLREFVGGR